MKRVQLLLYMRPIGRDHAVYDPYALTVRASDRAAAEAAGIAYGRELGYETSHVDVLSERDV